MGIRQGFQGQGVGPRIVACADLPGSPQGVTICKTASLPESSMTWPPKVGNKEHEKSQTSCFLKFFRVQVVATRGPRLPAMAAGVAVGTLFHVISLHMGVSQN